MLNDHNGMPFDDDVEHLMQPSEERVLIWVNLIDLLKMEKSPTVTDQAQA